ncbi:hypothetical protein RV18_GL003956 [Enterococcus termitis]|nr:hypothetical protein RV18_GL003956 [Enterococcus termitis]
MKAKMIGTVNNEPKIKKLSEIICSIIAEKHAKKYNEVMSCY